MPGKSIRIKRIMDKATGNFILVPMDHGVTIGPVKGIRNMEMAAKNIAMGGATGIVVHKGIVYRVEENLGNMGLLVHISASTTLADRPNEKVPVSDVKEVVSLGADAVSVQMNVGSHTESEMISDTGFIAGECRKAGMPLLVMTYPRGEKIRSQFDPVHVSHAVRIAEELGADIIKTNYTGSVDSFKDVIGSVSRPVVIAGGEKAGSDMDVLTMIYDAMLAGARGVSIGRNIFQHENVEGMVKAVRSICSDGKDPAEAIKLL